MSTRRRTRTAHHRSFERAPRVAEGGVVRRFRDDERSPGWFYGADGEGTAGYFPIEWFDLDATGAMATARRDYDAMELTIDAGVPVECLAEAAGWMLVRTDTGAQGWIPLACLE